MFLFFWKCHISLVGQIKIVNETHVQHGPSFMTYRPVGMLRFSYILTDLFHENIAVVR